MTTREEFSKILGGTIIKNYDSIVNKPMQIRDLIDLMNEYANENFNTNVPYGTLKSYIEDNEPVLDFNIKVTKTPRGKMIITVGEDPIQKFTKTQKKIEELLVKLLKHMGVK